MTDIMNVMVKDVNKAFELKESLKKNEKIKEVEIIKEKRLSGIWYNVAYVVK